MRPHRSLTAAHADRIAELELTVARMGEKLVAVEAERDELRAALDAVNDGMSRRLDRYQAERQARQAWTDVTVLSAVSS